MDTIRIFWVTISVCWRMGKADVRLKKTGILEAEILEIWREVTGLPELGPEDNFFALGGTPALATVLIKQLERHFGQVFHSTWLLAAPTVREQVRWMESSWMGGEGESPLPDMKPNPPVWRMLYDKQFAAQREYEVPKRKNPRACFILSPGRSGSTLLRAMLNGHPDLFAPPELELDLFYDMESRYKGLASGWSDLLGLESAVSQLWHCDHEEAVVMVNEWREANRPTLDVFRELQERCSPRTLVDQTTSLAVSMPALKRLEVCFEGAFYIHLQRHPLAMIRSWVRSNFAQVVPCTPQSAAEVNWVLAHQNVSKFFGSISEERKLAVRYEDVVTDPQAQMTRITNFLGLKFHPGMLDPYGDSSQTASPCGRFSGDKKFLQRNAIDSSAADSSRRYPSDGPLLKMTEALARGFGYESL